jgi:anti-sigma regulatory factor (Ser/Thr protein kinase)
MVDKIDAAELLTSELATNAVLHARTPFTVSATTEDHQLRVSVHDAHCEPFGATAMVAHNGAGADHPEHGRGLRIVDKIADAWDITLGPDGTTVWFAV